MRDSRRDDGEVKGVPPRIWGGFPTGATLLAAAVRRREPEPDSDSGLPARAPAPVTVPRGIDTIPAMARPRSENRPDDGLRPIQIVQGFLERSPASVLYASGHTKVLCTATLEPVVPEFLAGRGKGWATAEYDLLPGSTSPRHARERGGKLSGRTQEIQRLIGRSLRGVLDLKALDGHTLTIDCDVLQADGGTRTASINGAWVATCLLVRDAIARGSLPRSPVREGLGAVSVGLLDGRTVLDLDYAEDSSADVDLNLVLTESGRILEIQATSEGTPFSMEDLDRLTRLGTSGIRRILEVCGEAVGAR